MAAVEGPRNQATANTALAIYDDLSRALTNQPSMDLTRGPHLRQLSAGGDGPPVVEYSSMLQVRF
jgi:hypothetical protein